jgi:hypothetical protein
VIASLLACAQAWTVEGAVAPTLARADRDGDGRVTETEWAAVGDGVEWARADADGDGNLDLAELDALLRRQDPLAVPATARKAGAPARRDARVVDLAALLRVLAAEVRDAGGVPPSEAELAVASETGDVASPEAQAVLERLERASTGAGLRFPAGLRSDP